LKGISDYFKTPLKVAMQGGSGSGDSSSVIPGGGKDLTRKDGQVKASDDPAVKKTFNLTAARAAIEAEDAQRLKSLKEKIEARIETNPVLVKYKNQLLLDEQNRPMFALAKADLQPYTKEILHEIGFVLNDVPNRIGLSGHTDSTPYMSETGYSNWELSADRANASRRELIVGGMADAKVLRVVGLASAANLDKAEQADRGERDPRRRPPDRGRRRGRRGGRGRCRRSAATGSAGSAGAQIGRQVASHAAKSRTTRML
jgi:chemotaxis protein MotB